MPLPTTESLRVVVQARPLLPFELAHNAIPALQATSIPPQIQIPRPTRPPVTFSNFDAVYTALPHQPPDNLYTTQVAPLLDTLFDGLNSTVFAYGQTSAGKSYTMQHITNRVANHLFHKKQSIESPTNLITLRVGFVEIYKEAIRDLVDADETAGPVSVHVRDRRDPRTGRTDVFLDGAREKVVHNVPDLLTIVRKGALLRQTAATGMNASSSRSHSVITITIQQEPIGDPDPQSTFLSAKLHLVDLAGSERAKRTGVRGPRFAEGVTINRGLFSLAKVISTLATNARKPPSSHAHVPYRDSKLTRLLQHALGGNARTLLIACVSPADTSRDETLGTLRYAQQAKAIRNTPSVNSDPASVEVSDLRAKLARARAEIAALVTENDRLRHIRPRHSTDQPCPPAQTPPPALPGTDQLSGPRRRPRAAKTEPLRGVVRRKSDGVDEGSTEPRPALRAAGVSRTASASVLPRHVRGAEADVDIGGVAGVRADEMRRVYAARLKQAGEDREASERERVRLARELVETVRRHEREVEEGRVAFQARVSGMRSKLADVKRVQAEVGRLAKLKAGSEAARKRLAERVAVAERGRDEVAGRLAETTLRGEGVRKGLMREVRELGRAEKGLRGEVRRLEGGKARLEGVVARLRGDVESLKIRLRAAVGRGVVRRTVSGLPARATTRC